MIEIIEGHDPSSYFWIQPVSYIGPKATGDYWDDIHRYKEQEISIEEEDIRELLSYFFYKYFDGELPINQIRLDDYEGDPITGFVWYLTYNFYSLSAMSDMITEIDEVCKLLKARIYTPKLEELQKSGLWTSYYTLDNNLDEIINFYERFMLRINSMLAYCKENNIEIISIMGP